MWQITWFWYPPTPWQYFFTSLWHTIDRQLVQLITEYMSTISFSFLDSKSISATSPQYKCILCWEHRFNLKFILQSQDNNILYNKSLSSSLLCTIFKEKMTQFNTKVEVGKKKRQFWRNSNICKYEGFQVQS